MPKKFEAIKALDAAVAKGRAPTQRMMLAAFERLLKGVTAKSIADAIAKRKAGPILDLEAWTAFSKVASEAFLPEGPVGDVYRSAIARGAKEAPLKAVPMDLDPLAKKAEQYLGKRGGRLIRDMTTSTRKGVVRLVQQTFSGPARTKEAARLILKRKDFGLTKKQTEAFTKWVAKLLEDAQNPRSARFDLTAKEVNRKIDLEFKRRLRRRAKLIARTEAYNAGNEARLELWRESVAQGHIDAEEYVLQWITRVIGVCPQCQAMDRKTAEIKGGLFTSDPVASGSKAGQVLTAQRPTLHPACYCALRMIRRKDAKLGAAAPSLELLERLAAEQGTSTALARAA